MCVRVFVLVVWSDDIAYFVHKLFSGKSGKDEYVAKLMQRRPKGWREWLTAKLSAFNLNRLVQYFKRNDKNA